MKKEYTQRAIRGIQILLKSILFIIFYGSSNYTVASHVAGADISYQCTGTAGVYNITLKVYRDCSEAQLCANCPTALSPNCSMSLNIVGAAGACLGTNYGSQSILVVTSVSGFDIIQLCTGSKTICNNCGSRTPGSYTPGIELYTFSGLINLNALPASCCMVSVGWGSCCRNTSITTLTNPGSVNFFTEAIINRCATPCNSAPTFSTDPVVVICSRQDFSYNLGAIDPDGDSLSYGFGASLIASGIAAAFASPFSLNYPFPFLGAPIQIPYNLPMGIHLDPVKGDIRFWPPYSFIACLVIEVKQWKTISGVPTLVGITRRDLQLYSTNCAVNYSPVLRTYDASATLTSPQPNYAYSVCAGQQLCFNVSAWDNAGSSDTTDISWNAPTNLTSNGATFVKAYNESTRSTLGPRLDSMRFCWTPPASMAQNLPYYFVVNAKDRAFPLPAHTALSFSILVKRIPLATITKINKGCGTYDFGYSIYNGVAVNNSNTQFQVETAPHSNNYITYNGSTVSNHRFTHGGYHKIKLHLTTNPPTIPAGCPNDNIIDSILVESPVHVSIRDSFNCTSTAFTVQAHGSGGTKTSSGYNYTFFSGGLSSTNIIRATSSDSNFFIRALGAGSLNYKVVITDMNGCKDSTIFTINTGSSLPHEMTSSMRLCFGSTDTLNAGNNGGAVSAWHWFKSPALPALNNIFVQKIIAKDSGRYVVQKMDSIGCINYDTAIVTVNPRIELSAGSDRSLCSNNNSITITANGINILIDSFQWRQIPIINPSIILASNASLNISPDVSTSYQVKGFITYGGITCSNMDTVSVLIKTSPVIIHPSDISICKNNNTILLPVIISTNKPGQITSTWTYPLNPSAINANRIMVSSLLNQPALPSANPAGNFIKLSVNDSNGCSIKDSLVIAIFPTPVINAGPGRKFCDFAGAFHITPGSQLYTPNGGVMASNEYWFGNGIYKPNASQNYYAFNAQASGVKMDTNIITYRFTINYPLSNAVVFNPPLTGYSVPSPSGACIVSDTTIFHVIKTPKLEAGLASPVCKQSDSVYLDAFMLGRSTNSVNPLTSYWYIGAPDQLYRSAIINGRIFLPKHPVIADSTKQYVLIYADTSSTCRVADTTSIQVNENPFVSIGYITPGDSAVCTTKNTMKFALNPVGSFPYTGTTLTSVPALPGAFNVNTGLFNLSGVADGIYNVKYHYTDPLTYCDNWANVNIRVQGPPQLKILADQTVCDYDPNFTLTCTTAPNAPYSVKWTTIDGNGVLVDNSILGMTYTASAADKTRGSVTFRAQVMDTSVCNSITKQAVYTINPKPLADFTVANTTGCVDERYGIVHTPTYTSVHTGATNSSYYWYNNTLSTVLNADPVNDTKFTQTFTTPGKRIVYLVVEAKGCTDTANMPVEAYETPIAEFTSSPESSIIAKPYFDFNNKSFLDNGSMSYIWTMPSDVVNGPTRYFYDKDLKQVVFIADTALIPIWLTVSSDHRCVDSIRHFVKIESDLTVFIPNVFRPLTGGTNGAVVGLNRTFKVAATEYHSIEICVFNRLGQMVYKSNTTEGDGWDGKDRQTHQECEQDTYIYQINAVSYNNKKYTYSGSITLLR